MIALLAGVALAAYPPGTLRVDDWRPPIDADGLLVAEGASLGSRWEGRLDSSLAWHALAVYDAKGTEILVNDLMLVQASAGWRIGPLRLGARLPMGALLSGQDLEQPRIAAGDPGLELKISPWGDRRTALGLVGELALPLGGEQIWVGTGGLSWSSALILDGHAGPWRLVLDGGLRGQTEKDLVLDSDTEGPTLALQLTAKAALAREIGGRGEGSAPVGRISLEAQGATGDDPLGAGQARPLELLLGFQRQDQAGQSWRVGVGAGLLPGVGAPAARLTIGVGALGQ